MELRFPDMINVANVFNFTRDYAWLLILVFLSVETVAVALTNKTRYKAIVPPESHVDELSEQMRTHALTFAGMAFTVMALLVALGDNPGEFVNVLQVLAVVIVLMFFTYEVSEVTGTTRVWFMLQEKALGYGFLALFIAVVVLYHNAIPGVSGWLPVLGFVVVAGIRFFTVKRQFSMLRRRKQKAERDEQTDEQPEICDETELEENTS